MISQRTLLLAVPLALSSICALPASAQDDEYVESVRKPLVLPGKGHINVENLRNVDLNMDISELSIAELRVLRNGLAARQGHLFQSKDLRSLFSSTSWYDSLMNDRFNKVEESFSEHPYEWGDDDDYLVVYTQQADKYVPLKYTKAEQDFVARLKAREAELQQLNFKAPQGERVNTANIINPWQLEDFPEPLRKKLGQNGFAIVPDEDEQLFHIYEQNNYSVFPSFVTTDLYLQLFHFYFDCLLRDIEEQRLSQSVDKLCSMIGKELDKIGVRPANKQVRDATAWLQAYIAIAQALQTGQVPSVLPADYVDIVKDEVEKCNAYSATLSPFLGYKEVLFAYPLFRPRGHYTHSELLQRYFRAMMWLQTAPFSTKDMDEMRRAALLAHIVATTPSIKQLYDEITEPLTFLLGAPDNISILQVYDEVVRSGLSIEKLLASESQMQQLAKRVIQVASQQTRILPTDQVTAPYKVNLMPQRYMPDSEVLQEMADTKTKPKTLRKQPKALDIMAAMGVSSAERILVDELKEAARWPQYTEQLAKMKQRMGQIDWKETVATCWLDAMKNVPEVPENAPYFMTTPEWQKKSLNTALASYAELKHDAILYAKQPFGAECGGGGPPEPIMKGYVEPSVAFWRKAVALNEQYSGVLRRFNLMTMKAESCIESIGGMAQFLLSVSEKELAGKPLTHSEYDQIEIIGSNIEYISLELVRSADSYLDSWNDVTGADRKVACIADVYTANAFNVPLLERAVLYEAVGPAYKIYVIVEIEGQLWLTRGAVFSYRELERSASDPRLTDEEWQEWLETHPDDGTPEWMNDIMVPLKQKPKTNDAVFYSTGC